MIVDLNQLMKTVSYLTIRTSLNSLLITTPLMLLLSGCSLLFGSIKPTEEKSNTYTLLNLSKLAPTEWEQLSSQSQINDDTASSEESDISFQSKKTGAIISINSACRANRKKVPALKELTEELLLGFVDSQERVEKEIQVSSTPALMTTLEGTLNQKSTKVRTVVLLRGSCVYDLMYIAKPQSFKIHEEVFQQFFQSLNLKD
jgi:hypothetical protein